MPVNRRTFLSQAAVLGSNAWLTSLANVEKPSFKVSPDFSLKILATNWGFSGSFDAFCAQAKEAGYDGIEVWLPQQEAEREQLFTALDKYKLALGLLAAGGSSDFSTHLKQFQQNVEAAVKQQPLFVNCHSGRDYFSFEQNRQLIEFTTALTRSSGVKIYHETHRSRILFAAHIAKNFIEQLPQLRLTLDISHWCNVHESLLQDQQATVQLALDRTDHIHARVGHAESPQITDPRAPEWENEVKTHFAWWDYVVKKKVDAGQPLTVTTEFGPPNYMAALPYTRQPIANLWEVNAHMMQLWRQRYA